MVTENQKSAIGINKKKEKANPNTTLMIVIKSKENKKARKKTYKNKYKTINNMAIRTYKSIITLNVNGLNVPTKRHILAEWIQK